MVSLCRGVVLVLVFVCLLSVMPGMQPACADDATMPAATGTDAAIGEDAQDGTSSSAAEELAAESVRREAEKTQREVRQAADTEQKVRDIEEFAHNELLKDIWSSQRSRVNAVIEEATKLSENFLKDVNTLEKLRPMEEEISRMLIMVAEFRQWPSALEAVYRRLGLSEDLTRSMIFEAAAPQINARKLLGQLDNSVDSLNEISVAHLGESAEYMKRINTARFMLTAIIARYASVLAPTNALVQRVSETRAEINRQLPRLWLQHYSSGPVPWLDFSQWTAIPQSLKYLSLGINLRRYVELPLTTSQWQAAISRFVLTMLLSGIIMTIIADSALRGFPEIQRHIKLYSLPLNVLGAALLAASYNSSLEPFKLFMALGNICLIMGQITLAWDLRRIKFPDIARTRSPFLCFVPSTLTAYVLVYLPLPQLVTLAAWTLVCVINIIYVHWRQRQRISFGDMELEPSILDMQPVILWPCLIICLLGFHFYSIGFYLLYSSIAIAVQFSMGSMSIISRMNQKLNDEDRPSLLASTLLALAAPVTLMLSFSALSLWLATLPGGLDILQFYIFKSVSIGETQFNFVQVLLIITAFFMARTASTKGKVFITRLPERGSKIDRSLITPLQTVYFYLVWFVFVLFVLRSLGMNLSNLAVIAGGLSVGIGFGLQTIVNNFISGIILIFSRTLQVGDIVEVGGVVGHIKQITVRATVIETYDSAIIYVPNSAFVSGNLTNWTSNSRSCRQHVFVSVAYGSDPQQVVKVLLDICNKHRDTLAFPKPSVLFRNFGESNLDFRLSFWVKDYDMGSRVASDIRFLINTRFQEEGIEMAYPTVDVHLAESPKSKPATQASLSRLPVVHRKYRVPRRRRPLSGLPAARSRGEASPRM